LRLLVLAFGLLDRLARIAAGELLQRTRVFKGRRPERGRRTEDECETQRDAMA
jgi:hypothetical protein